MTDADVKWLDDEEAAAWMPLLSTAMWLPAALDLQLQEEAGISHFEYGVMAALSTSEGRARRMRDLASVANSTLPRLSKVVDRLERQGWVQRRPDPNDGRVTLAVLTDAGMAKVEATAPGHVARVRELIFDHLTRAQIRQLGVIASRIADAVGPEGGCASRLK